MKKLVILVLIALVLGGGLYGYQKYMQIFAPNVPDSIGQDVLEIPTGSGFEEVVQALNRQRLLINEESFRWVADKMNYTTRTVKSGKFRIRPGMNNRALVGLLRSGAQTPVKLTIRAARNLPALAGMVSPALEFDSTALIRFLLNEWLPGSAYDEDDAMTQFIPNTYEFYWNTSPEEFIGRMQKEHLRFWNENRKEKARDLGLTPGEVYILASIVERETQHADERSRIAGVYLNRLKKGMPLQADPTVIFAHQDFTIRRVLNRHLEIDSPYNTYKYAGLPPGPICMPTIRTIDATLNAEDHTYLYFCVDPDTPGTHAFASTLSGHLRNARKYQQWANRNGIR